MVARCAFKPIAAALLVWLGFASSAVVAQDRDQEGRVVETTKGRVRGVVDRGIERYLGIRYAAAPVGDLRFKPPVAAAAWDGTASAEQYGPRCIQAILALGRESDDGVPQSEDCLFLNVWTPASDDKERPVMVWLHGGGFAWGSGGEAVYEGTNMAQRGDVVVVTLNHRLNLFGFTNLSRLGPEYKESINVGMLDIVQALRWVRDNIAAFGGDPANVTVFGESGGAAKVSHLLGMPAGKGLFGKAIIQSGADPRGMDADSIARDTRDIFAAAGMTSYDPDFIKTVPADHLVERAINLFKKGDKVDVRFRRTGDMEDTDMAARLRTVVDGRILPRHPFDPDATPVSKDVSVMVGWTKDEWTLMLAAEDPDFVKITDSELRKGAAQMYSGLGPEILEELRHIFPDYAPGHLAAALTSVETSYETLLVADRKAAQPAPVYVYALQWETPVHDGMMRSPHSLDVPLVFNNVEARRDLVGPGPDPQRMADIMTDAWIAFARHGAPQTKALPDWPEYDPGERAVMYLDLQSRVEYDPLARVHDLVARARAKTGMPSDAPDDSAE